MKRKRRIEEDQNNKERKEDYSHQIEEMGGLLEKLKIRLTIFSNSEGNPELEKSLEEINSTASQLKEIAEKHCEKSEDQENPLKELRYKMRPDATGS